MTPERRDALFAPLGSAKGLLVAVSGGPDSTALLWLASQWASAAETAPFVAAATVDHGLRPESAAEAASVAEFCERLGVTHATLVWEGEKPATALPERAREARYRLLATHAGKIGADTVVTAHHLDDQAATVLMRLLRGSGVAGLAAMATISERDGVKIARPLLEVSKAELVACCQAAGLLFFDDPSNRNAKFLRPRLREMLEREGLDARSLARLARRAARAEAALKTMTAEAEARLGLVAHLTCDLDALLREPEEIGLRLLAAAIGKAGARDPRGLSLEKIEAMAEGLARARLRGETFGANVGGALVKVSRVGMLEVAPEPPRRRAARDPWSNC